MPEEITLKIHQQEVVDWTHAKFKHLDPKRFGLFFAPRVGKTYVLLALCDKYNVDALIIVPKGIKKQWQELTEGTGHLIVTKEEFRRDHKILQKFNAFIFDEAHHASNTKSQLTKACLYYMKKHNPEFRWLATGTPYRSNPMSIFGLGRLLGMPWDYWKFFNEFYTMVSMGARMVPVLKKGTEAKLEKYVRSIGITLLLEDVPDVVTMEPKEERVDFELTPEQEEAINNLEDPTAIARFTKIHAIEQGYLPGDEYVEPKDLWNKKDDFIYEKVSEIKKIAIVCRFTYQIEHYESCFKMLGRTVFVINGATKDRNQMVKDIEVTDDCVVILQAACCEGFNLSSVDTMIFASMSFSHSDHIQMKDRLVRMDRPKVNTYYYLIGGLVDSAVYENVMKKMDFHMQIFCQRFI